MPSGCALGHHAPAKRPAATVVAPSPGHAPDPPLQAKANPSPEIAAAQRQVRSNAAEQMDDNTATLLDKAVALATADSAPRVRPGSEESPQLPLTPTRAQVARVLTAFSDAVGACARGESGTAIADLIIRNTGRVAHVRVRGKPFENRQSGRCIEGVLRRARFSPFVKASLRVRCPLVIGERPAPAAGTTSSRQ
ncbi:MAG: hypothetical protein MJD61_15870 [Proteobacteria bacterium]|nr:hypothetical protein [Pseudomonadota bacterium]